MQKSVIIQKPPSSTGVRRLLKHMVRIWGIGAMTTSRPATHVGRAKASDAAHPRSQADHLQDTQANRLCPTLLLLSCPSDQPSNTAPTTLEDSRNSRISTRSASLNSTGIHIQAVTANLGYRRRVRFRRRARMLLFQQYRCHYT
jgi:hypothetical protein